MKLLHILFSISMFSLAACSSAPTAKPQKAWVKDGSYVLARSIPPVSETSGAILGGLMPLPAGMKQVAPALGTLCSIDRASGKVSLRNGDKEIAVYNAEPSSSIESGMHKVALKQAAPAWYAPDSYFMKRKLVVPPNGSRDRMLRGALGNSAIFLENGAAIHDSKISSEDVVGVRVSSQALAELSKLLPLGSAIEIK